MKITDARPGALELYKIQHEKNQGTKNEREVQEKDRAEISPRGMEMQKYRGVLATMPDVRAERVQELKKSIAAGTYKPNAEKIAEKLIEERHLDTRV